MNEFQELAGNWTLIGHLSAALGVGEVARGLSNVLKDAGCSVDEINSGGTRSTLSESRPLQDSAPQFSRVISCVNPDQLGYVVAKFRLNPWNLKCHIGLWSWELPNSPRYFGRAADLLDEVWTVSEYCKSSISQQTTRPVRVARIPIELKPLDAVRVENLRTKFHIRSDDFVFLVSFDYFSDHTRKNPDSAIRAYLDAFPKVGRAKLIIKSMNSARYSKIHQRLRQRANWRADIIFIDEVLSGFDYESLIAISNVTLSPHRSEGLGLNLQKAMAHGRVVVATGWSGNMEFMNPSNSLPVEYNLHRVKAYGGLRVNSYWAEPNHDHLVALLRDVESSASLAANLGKKAKEHMDNNFSVKAASKFLSSQF